MNPYPGRNPKKSVTNRAEETDTKESVTNKAEETGIVTSYVPWYLPAYFPVSRTTTTGAPPSQVSQPKPTESRNNNESSTNQSSSKPLKPKQGTKKRPASKNSKKAASNIPETRRERKNPEINNIDVSRFNVSRHPPPVCSCTGVSRTCYKWGIGGWQSSCCTLTISMFPLPMSTTRPGTRMTGRKMSNGAYVKLLLRLDGEGYDLSKPVDLKNHWARHGTNKFVTIKSL